jgi:hypothetical protein
MHSAMNARTTLAPPDAFACVMKAFETENFSRTSYDKDELRTTARKVNPKIHFSNTQFRKAYDLLEVKVASGADGATQLGITASTAAEYFSQQGPIFETKKTSPEAEEAARKIAERCAG